MLQRVDEENLEINLCDIKYSGYVTFHAVVLEPCEISQDTCYTSPFQPVLVGELH